MPFLRIRNHWGMRAIGVYDLFQDLVRNAPSVDIGRFDNGALLYMHRYGPDDVQFIIQGNKDDRSDIDEIVKALEKGRRGLVEIRVSPRPPREVIPVQL